MANNSEKAVAARLKARAELQGNKDRAAERADLLINLGFARQIRVGAMSIKDPGAQAAARAQGGEEIKRRLMEGLGQVERLPTAITIRRHRGGPLTLNTQSGDLFTTRIEQGKPIDTLVDPVGWCETSHWVLSGVRSQLINLHVDGSIELPPVPVAPPAGPV